MHREVEAKFIVPDLLTFARLRDLKELAGYTIQEAAEVAVRDSYVDTSRRDLLAAGMALRSREINGQTLLTMKSLGASSGPVYERNEMEVGLAHFSQPREWPDGELRRIVISIIGDTLLEPLLDVNQRRIARKLAREGRVAAEMSLDQVRVLAGGRERTYCELEIELLPDGTGDDLSLMVEALASDASLVPSTRSKFEEGVVLLDAGSSRAGAVETESARRPARTVTRFLRLEAPAGTTEEAVLAELARMGYRARARSRRRDVRQYCDTQAGGLLRQDIELYLSQEDSRWHVLRDGRKVRSQRGEQGALPAQGPVARILESVIRGKACFPILEASFQEAAFSLESISMARLRLIIRTWRFSSPLHDVPAQEALTLAFDRGAASTFERDYVIELLRNNLGLQDQDSRLPGFGLSRLGAPVPGAPLPPEFLPAAGEDLPAVCSRILAGEAWRMKANAPGAVRDLDPEFVHDIRVATRRARFACRLFAEVLGEETHDRLKAELSWIAGILGEVRDLDVLRGRLSTQLSRVDADPSFASTLGELLDTRRASARERLVTALESPRFSALLEMMAAAQPPSAQRPPAGAQPDAQAAEEFGRKRISKARSKVAAWKSRDPEDMSVVDLHRLRILFKRLRYTAEFFRSILGEEAASVARECVPFQDCLGLHQDARVTIEVLTGFAVESSMRDTAPVLLTLGALVQVQRDLMREQREKFQILWKSAPGRKRHDSYKE